MFSFQSRGHNRSTILPVVPPNGWGGLRVDVEVDLEVDVDVNLLGTVDSGGV